MKVQLPDGSVPHAVVDDVGAPQLDDDTWHHLTRVRRLRPGSAITVTDGAGSWRPATLGDDGAVDPTGDVVTVDRSEPPLTVAFALTKGAKPDLVVQKLTEVGVDRIVAFAAERSVVRWDDAKVTAQHRRWQAIARGAVEQSRRAWLPLIDPLTGFDDVLGLGATLVDRGGEPLTGDDTVVAIGPEGGWSDAERAAATRRVSLGPAVLRAETAAIAAGVLVDALRRGRVDVR